jgi:hypothetical protein
METLSNFFLMQSLPVAMVASLFMSFLSTIVLFPISLHTDMNDMNYTAVILGGIIIISVVCYYFPKYGGVHWFTGPILDINLSSIAMEDLRFSESTLYEKTSNLKM